VPIVAGSLRERDAAVTATALSGALVSEAARTRLFWTLIAVIFGSGLLISGFIVHGAALLTDRSFTAAQAALVISIYGASNLAGRLLTGTLLDRYSAPRVAAVLLMVLAGGGLLLSRAHAMETAIAAAILVGLGAGGEMDINPYLLSRYFGMRSLSTLYGFNWMALGVASTIGPVMMGRAFDATRSYEWALVTLAVVTLGAAALMLTLPAPSRGVARRPDDENRVA
jgi:MFS family permease